MFNEFEKYTKQTDQGIVMFITIISNASKSVLEIVEDTIKLKIAAPAVDGKANKAIISFLLFFSISQNPKSKSLKVKNQNIKLSCLRYNSEHETFKQHNKRRFIS
jgi:uncharacterized protein YggU (UPF0235/DUF167 family)